MDARRQQAPGPQASAGQVPHGMALLQACGPFWYITVTVQCAGRPVESVRCKSATVKEERSTLPPLSGVTFWCGRSLHLLVVPVN